MHRWLIPAILVVFCLISIVTLKSVAASLATIQLLFFIVGTSIFVTVSKFPFTFWKEYRWLGYGMLLFLLMLTLGIGTVTRGTTSWIPIGPYHLQPSQLAVPLAALLLAGQLTNRDLSSWKNLGHILLLMALPVGFIMIEPDLGTSVIYLASLGSLLLVSNVPVKYLALLAGSALLVLVLAWNLVLKDYQKERITSFVSAQSQETDAHYNAQQSLIAVGSGQVFGRGLGQGVQSHLRFLPERQTDFIFASFAEEWGFVGSIIMVSLYILLVGYILYLSTITNSETEQYYCLVIGVMIAIQSIVNIGMNIGLLPITGITLPFVSYGGSSLLSLLFALGIVYGVAQRQPHVSRLRHFE